MKLTKQSKIRMLENFYGLDVLYFGENASKNISKVCCPALIEEYAVNKGVLLSIVGEMYELIQYSPIEDKNISKTKSLMENYIIPMVFTAKSNAKEIISLDETKLRIKNDVEKYLEEKVEDVNTISIDELIESKILDKMLTISTDNLLIIDTFAESKDPLVLKKPEGTVLMSAYKVMRDSLIESVLMIKESVEAASKDTE